MTPMTDWRYWITYSGTVSADDEDSARDQAFDRISRWFDHPTYLTSAPEVELEQVEQEGEGE